jgi:hypothetical protein
MCVYVCFVIAFSCHQGIYPVVKPDISCNARRRTTFQLIADENLRHPTKQEKIDSLGE